jgi:hypothetical protein
VALMARDHAEIYLSIWDDKDWLELSAGAKGMYVLLLSQRKLDYAGVLYLNVARWATLSPDTDEADVCKALEELHERGFIVIDTSTNELLIRAFFRRDIAKVGKNGGMNANLIRAALNDANRADSRLLRAVLVREVYRCAPLPLPIEESVSRFPDLSNPPDDDGVDEGVRNPLRDRVAEDARNKEQGTRNTEQGTWNSGTGSSERGVGNRRGGRR